MQKLVKSILFLAVCFFISLPSHASELHPKWGHWMMYYYFSEGVESVPEFLDVFDKSGLLVKGNAKAPFAGTLSQIFIQNQDEISGWLDKDFSAAMKEVLAVSLLLADLKTLTPPSYGDEIEKASDSYGIKSILTINPVTPADLDMMWGAFFASGNSVFVEKIIAVFDKTNSPTGDKMDDALLRGAAQWSLGSNMEQHALVERIVKANRVDAMGSVKTALDEIWDKFEENKKGLNFEKYEGDFSARLMPVDPAIMDELKKPSYEGLHVKTKTEARRGEDVIFHLIFSGMDLSKDFESDVTYDLKVLYPDGKAYFDDKNLEGYRGRSSKRFSVFSTADLVGVHFEDDDPLGEYKIYATIRDNISGNSLDFTTVVELIE